MKDREAPHYLGHRQRLRERLTRDPGALADYEILELVLAAVQPRRDTKPLAKAILARFGSLKEAMLARPAQLADLAGVGPAVLAHWTLLAELYARMAEAGPRKRQVLSGPEEVAGAAMARIGSLGTEEFWAAFLDNKNRVIAWERVSSGTVDQTPVYPREILSRALLHQAANLILAHNHPGGSTMPSEEDRLLTMRIVKAARELGVGVLDHLVVTDSEFYSFNDHGLL